MDNAPFFVTKVPDIDNMVKLVLDALQGVTYNNDSSVVHMESAKLWNPCQKQYHPQQSSEGYTLIKVEEYTNELKQDGCSCLACKARN